jgi:hypothetical protein
LFAADIPPVAFGQHKPGNFVHTLRAKKRREREFNGIPVATVHEPVVFTSGGVHEDRMAAIERQNGQLGFVT